MSGSDSVSSIDARKFTPPSADEYAGLVAKMIPGRETSLIFMRAILSKALSGVEAPHVLVVGAGGGEEIIQLAEGNPTWRFTAEDLSEQMVDMGKQRIAAKGLSNEVAWFQGPVDQVEALFERLIDVSISRAPVDDSFMCCLPLWKDPAVVALPLGHRLAQRGILRIADLKRERFVLLRREGSPFARHIYQRCAEAGFMPAIAQTVEEIPAQLYLVAAGLGVAIVPQSARARISDIASCKLEDDIMDPDVYAVYRKDNDKKALHAFLSEARQLETD